MKPLFLTASMMAAPQTSVADVAGDWRDAWTRCRVAIESGEPILTDGLVEATQAEAEQFSIEPQFLETDDRKVMMVPGRRAPDQIWRSEGDLFWVGIWFYEGETGVRRVCDVIPVEPLTPSLRDSIEGVFNAERGRLVASETHKTMSYPPIPPASLSGFGSSAHNPNGRCTVSSISFELGGDWFSSGTGEQVEGACDLPTLRVVQ